jgi:hypothetical protein
LFTNEHSVVGDASVQTHVSQVFLYQLIKRVTCVFLSLHRTEVMDHI